MKIFYHCDVCGAPIAALDLEPVDEEKLGLTALTEREKEAIIRIDLPAGAMHIQSLCDDCIAALGLAEELPRTGYYGPH